MMRKTAFALTLGVAFTTLVFAEDNWPQFRGPDGMGHSDATGLPVTWSETQNIKWKTAIHDKGWASPVIWKNQIWMTTATEDGKQLFVIHGYILFQFPASNGPRGAAACACKQVAI